MISTKLRQLLFNFILFFLPLQALTTSPDAFFPLEGEETEAHQNIPTVVPLKDYDVTSAFTLELKENLEDLSFAIHLALEALEDQRHLVLDMNELIVRASFDFVSESERFLLNDDFKATLIEFEDIAESVLFGDISLLGGARLINTLHVQIGPLTGDEIGINFMSSKAACFGTLELTLDQIDISTQQGANRAYTVILETMRGVGILYGRLAAKHSFCDDLLRLRDVERLIQQNVGQDNLLLVTQMGVDSLFISQGIIHQMISLAHQAVSENHSAFDRFVLHGVFMEKCKSLHHILRTTAWNHICLFNCKAGVEFISPEGALREESVKFPYLSMSSVEAGGLSLNSLSIRTCIDANLALTVLNRKLNKINEIYEMLAIKQVEFEERFMQG